MAANLKCILISRTPESVDDEHSDHLLTSNDISFSFLMTFLLVFLRSKTWIIYSFPGADSTSRPIPKKKKKSSLKIDFDRHVNDDGQRNKIWNVITRDMNIKLSFFFVVMPKQWRCLLMFVMPHCRRIIFIFPFSCVTMMKKRMFVSVICSNLHNKCLEIAVKIGFNESVLILDLKNGFFVTFSLFMTPTWTPTSCNNVSWIIFN